MTSPFIPCSFTYGDAPQGGVLMPMIKSSRNPSNTIDTQYESGYLWLSDLNLGGSGNMYYQGGNTAGIPNWTLVANSGGVLNTLSDGSTTVNPSGGNIALVSTPNQITVTSSAPSHELIYSIPTTFIAPGSIASTTTVTAGTDLTVTNSATIGNDLTVTDDVTIGGDLNVSGAIVLAGLTVAGTVLLNTTGNANTTIGNAAGTGAILINTPSGDFTLNGNANEIHIGDDAAANILVIGSQTGAASLHLQAGTGDLLIDGSTTSATTIGGTAQTGLITLGRSTAGQDIDIGSAINASAQVIDIANGASGANSTVRILSGTGTAGVGTLALGNNPRVTIAGLADVAPSASRNVTVGGGTITTAVTDTIDIGPDGATTNAGASKVVNVNTGGVTLGSVLTNIATGAVTSGTHTTAIATGNRAAGTMAVNILTGTGTKTFSAGNADGLTTFNFIGPSNINASQNSNTAINSGTSTGTVTIGNSLAGAITMDTAAGISLDSATASNFTVTGVADLTVSSVGGSVVITGTEAAVDAVQINATTALGGVDINAGTGGATLDSGGLISIDAAAASNFTVTGAGLDLLLNSVGGSVLVESTEDAALAIRLHANGGTSETIQIHSDQGTGVASVGLLSDVGGITLRATGLASADAINIEAPAGGLDVNTALEINIDSSQAAATAINLVASGAAGGITMAAGTGNINMTGNVLKSTNPAFLGYVAATQTNVTGAGTAYTIGTGATITEVFDRGSNFTTSGVFTAPVTGIYDLHAQVTITGTTIATTFVISIVTTARTYTNTFIKAAGSQDESVQIRALCDMSATNTAHVTIAVTGEGGDTDDVLGSATLQTYFCGCLVA